MATAKRTLWIEARLQDLLSRPLTDVEKRVAKLTTDLSKKGPDGGNGFFGGLLKQLTSVKTLIAGVAAGVLSFQGAKLATGVASDAAALARLAEVTGDSVRNLSELSAAMDVAGGKGEDLTGSMRALQAAARQATSGNVEVLRSFQALGIELEDLQQLSPSQLFERLAAGLEKYSTAQEKELRLGKLLPEQFQRLLPLIGRGLEEFQRQILAVRGAGAGFGKGEADILERFDRSLGLLKVSFEGLVRSLVTEFAPELTVVFERLSKLIADNRGGLTAIASTLATGVAKGIDLVIRGLIELIGVIERVPFVDLIDTKEVDKQIAEVQAKLREAFQNPLSSLDAGKIQLGIPQLQDRLRELLEARESPLAAQLRDVRAQMLAELSTAAAQIRGGGAAGEVDANAAAHNVGIPSPEDLERMRAGYAALGETLAGVKSNSSTPSVFVPTPGAGATAQRDPREQARQQLAELQRLAALAPAFKPLQDRLAELQRDASVLELEAASKGAANADLLAQAIAHVNEEFEKSKRLVTGGDFGKGFSDGARKSIQAFTDLETAGEEAGQQLVGGSLSRFSDMVGAAIARVMSWKDAVHQFAQAAIADLGRVGARLATVAFLSAIGLEGGGVAIGGTAPLRAMAGGGIVTGPELLLAGEGEHDEAIVPMPNGAVPVKFVGGGRERGVTIVNHWTVHTLNGKDAARVLYDNKETINALMASQVESQMGWRGRITRASR